MFLVRGARVHGHPGEAVTETRFALRYNGTLILEQDPKPMFGGHPTPEDPNRKLWGTVFRKPAALVLATTAPAKET